MPKEVLAEPAQKLADKPESREPQQESNASRQGADSRLLQLQRAVGNRRVSEWIGAGHISRDGRLAPVQAKLRVGAANDAYEQEADRVARQVVSTSDAALRPGTPPGGSAGAMVVNRVARSPESVHRDAEIDEKREDEKDTGEEQLHRQASFDGNDGFDVDASVENRLDSSKGSGGPLPQHVRSYMEPRFGMDFGQVRVHTGSDAATLSESVGAKAFTHGSEIYYGAGHSPDQLELTAHELTHVVQQGGGSAPAAPQRKTDDKDPAPCTACAEKQQDFMQRSVEEQAMPRPEHALLNGFAPPAERFAQNGHSPASPSAGLASQPIDAPMRNAQQGAFHPAPAIARSVNAAGAPPIQRAWYNFDIPFTDYQFDPSLEGVKTAANVVKDTAVGAFDWIVDEIKSVVSSGIDWLTEKWNELENFASSALDSAKNAFTNIVGLLKNPLGALGDALTNLDAQALTAAWSAFSGFITTVANGFKAMTDGILDQVNKVWGSISSFATSALNRVSSLTENFLFKKLPDALQRIAFAVIDQLKSLWNDINDKFTKLLARIKTWVDSAIDTVFNFVRKVASFGINVVIAGIVEFGHIIAFVKDLFSNPQKYVDLLAKRTVAAFDGVEARFSGLIGQYFGSAKTAAPAAGPQTKVQRAPATAAPAEAKTSASWGEIGDGVLGMMAKKWNDFKSNPMAVITGMLVDMIFPLAGNIKDIIQLYKDIKKIVTSPLSAGSLEEFWTSFLQILDIPILIYHTIVSILMRSTMLPLIVATFIPHPLVKAIAAAVGYALLGAFVEAEELNLGQKLLLLKTGATTKAQKEEAYNRIADSLIALAMTAVIIIIMLILHFIASVMKGVYNFVKGRIFAIDAVPAEGKGTIPDAKKPTEPGGKSTDVDPAQPKPGSVDSLVICRVCTKVPGMPTDLMTQRANLSPEMRTYLDTEAGKIFSDPANPTPENFKTFRDFMEDAAKSGGGDLESGLRNKAASAGVGGVTAPIDFDGHITDAEIKPNGDVVGGHSTATGKVKVIPGTEAGRNPSGVYKAKIQVEDPANPGNYLPKTNNGGFSTLFPDSWSADRIKVEVDAAYKNKTITGNKWQGTTPSGVRVEGYVSPKTTVYPLL